MSKENARVKIDKVEKEVVLVVSDFKFAYNFNYLIESEPDWFND